MSLPSYGFIRGSKITIDRDREKSIELLSAGQQIVGFVEGKLFPSLVGMWIPHYVSELIEVVTPYGFLRGGSQQPVYQYNSCVKLEDLEEGDILVRGNGEPVKIRRKRKMSICAPIYIVQVYPELPFIVNDMIVGSVELKGEGND